MRFARPRSSKHRAFLEQMLPGLAPIFEAGIVALTPLIADEMARRASESDGVPEPAVPESGGRFLAAPVDSMAVSSSSR